VVEESTSIRERLVAPGVASIDIVGDVTAQAENSLMDAYQRATSAGARTFILNLTGLRYMNSSGIGLLVTLLIRVNRQQERLVVHGLSDHYRRIFSLTRLDEAITIFASEAEALAASRVG
jgi:anti-sigma B factor antagonist